ncbi:MAG: DNA polymerase III subunit beta [Deltaproteobacteria bacterium]|nr:MAG: DNA polymerase III subunit beta [Deltaproteobacteria bacterium]
MEFEINSDDLNAGLSNAQGIVEKRTAMPILSNVLVESIGDGEIKLVATDLEVGLVCRLAAKVKNPGSMAVSARHLYEVVRGFKNQKVSIKLVENNQVLLKCGSSEYKFLGMPPEDFQKPVDPEDVGLSKVDAEQLSEMIEKTYFAISTEEARHSLNGAFLEKVGDKFRLTATDGHRLAMVERPMIREGDFGNITEGLLLPRKGLMEAKRVIENLKSEASIGHFDNSLVLKVGSTTLVMRLLDGQFPDYRKVIPDEQKIRFSADRKKLMDSLRRVSIFSVDKNMGVKLTVKKNALLVTNSNPDLGEAKEEIEIDYTGESMTIGFNARYLLDAMSVMSGEAVSVSMDDDISPGVFKEQDDPDFTCVVMPMRI